MDTWFNRPVTDHLIAFIVVGAGVGLLVGDYSDEPVKGLAVGLIGGVLGALLVRLSVPLFLAVLASVAIIVAVRAGDTTTSILAVIAALILVTVVLFQALSDRADQTVRSTPSEVESATDD